MLVLSQAEGKTDLIIHALKNNFEADAYFVKVMGKCLIHPQSCLFCTTWVWNSSLERAGRKREESTTLSLSAYFPKKPTSSVFCFIAFVSFHLLTAPLGPIIIIEHEQLFPSDLKTRGSLLFSDCIVWIFSVTSGGEKEIMSTETKPPTVCTRLLEQIHSPLQARVVISIATRLPLCSMTPITIHARHKSGSRGMGYTQKLKRK